MTVFSVKKVKDYTIMPNLHLRNRQLSLRAKGLLCQILSIPPEWNFTLQGLAYVIRRYYDGHTRIRTGGIITRARVRNEEGQLREMEYTIYSSPKLNDNYFDNTVMENPTPNNPT